MYTIKYYLGGSRRGSGSSGRAFLGCTRQGVAGALGSGVAVLGSGCGLLLGLEGARQGGIACILALAFRALSGGDGLVSLVTSEPSRGGIDIPGLGVDGGVASMAALHDERAGARVGRAAEEKT